MRQAGNPAFNDVLAYTYAMVQRDEGPRMIANLVEVDIPDGVAVGMALETTHKHISDDYTLVKFKPA